LEANKETALKLAQSWNTWENALLQRSFADSSVTPLSPHEADKLMGKYKIQSHYLQNLCFFPEEGLLPHLSSLTDIQIDLLQGRLDWVCRPESSWIFTKKSPAVDCNGSRALGMGFLKRLWLTAWSTLSTPVPHRFKNSNPIDFYCRWLRLI
jgi:hypothetical protein